MTAPIQVQVNVQSALQRLQVLVNNAENLGPVFAGPINQSLNEVFVRQFETEGAAYGTKWRKLSPATLQLRKRRGHGRGGILRDTGVLWASFTKMGLGPHAIKNVTPTSIERGSTLPYGKYHQTGYESKTFVVTGGKGRNIYPVALKRKHPIQVPARPIIPDPFPGSLGRGQKVVNSWAQMIADFITKEK
jgi:hypothetical protein